MTYGIPRPPGWYLEGGDGTPCDQCGKPSCLKTEHPRLYCTRGHRISDWFVDFDPVYVMNRHTRTVHFMWSGDDGLCSSIPQFGPQGWNNDNWLTFGSMPEDGKRICGSCELRIARAYRSALAGETEWKAEAR